MGITSLSPRPHQERETNPSPANSPTSNGSSTTSVHFTPTPPPTPNPYPTTFVQADTSNFKKVVQMLTGSSGCGGGIPPIKSIAQKKQGFKLYERRNSLKNGLMINTFVPGPSPERLLSPSILDFPALTLSPATPANGDTLTRADVGNYNQEEKAIAAKRFYFHPSPRTAAGPPQLLPLFPVTSPRVSGSIS